MNEAVIMLILSSTATISDAGCFSGKGKSLPGVKDKAADQLQTNREYIRLHKITSDAKGWRVDSHPTGYSEEKNEEVPWLADIGRMVDGKAFIRFCAASVVNLEGTDRHIPVTSAACAKMLEKAGEEASMMITRGGNRQPLVTQRWQIRRVKYQNAKMNTIDPNIAILDIDGRVVIPDQTKWLHLPSKEDTVEFGHETWRVPAFGNGPSGTIAVIANIEQAEIIRGSGGSAGLFSAKIMKEEVWDTDLGGSPFYVLGSRPGHGNVLRGIRAGLTGDRFADIIPFTKWITNNVDKKGDWIDLTNVRCFP